MNSTSNEDVSAGRDKPCPYRLTRGGKLYRRLDEMPASLWMIEWTRQRSSSRAGKSTRWCAPARLFAPEGGARDERGDRQEVARAGPQGSMRDLLELGERALKRRARAQDADALPHQTPHALAHGQRRRAHAAQLFRRRLALALSRLAPRRLVRRDARALQLFRRRAPRPRAEDETFQQRVRRQPVRAVHARDARALFAPLLLTCQKGSFADVKKVEGGGGLGQGRRDNYFHPESSGNLGELAAIDAVTGQIRWVTRQRAPFNTATLTTGGGMVFVGDWNRYISAYDVSSGKLLWQNSLTTSPQGFPISYTVGERQYIAMPVGVGAASWGTAIPLMLTPDVKRPNTGNALFVFARRPPRTWAEQRTTIRPSPVKSTSPI